MKRLFRIMPVVCVLVFVLAVHAFAVQDYLFEWYEVQVLPDFVISDEDANTVFIYEGMLNSGCYEIYFFSDIYDGVCLLDADISFVYIPDRSLYFFEESFVFESFGESFIYSLTVYYLPEEDVSLCMLSSVDDLTLTEYSLGSCLRFVPVADSPSEPVESFLPDVLVELFGPYEQQTETVTEVLPDGSSVTYERLITGVAGLDWEWLSSVGLFALVVFCFFRIVGGVLKQ